MRRKKRMTVNLPVLTHFGVFYKGIVCRKGEFYPSFLFVTEFDNSGKNLNYYETQFRLTDARRCDICDAG